MEKEKQSFWKRFKSFIKKVIPGKKTIAIGAAAASMMGATMDKADASNIQSDTNNKVAVTDTVRDVKTNPIDLTNLRVDSSELQNTNVVSTKNDFEKFMDTAKTVSQGINDIKNVAGSIQDLGNSSNISSTINNTERIVNNVNKSEETLSQLLSKPSVKDEIKTENSEVSTKEVSDIQESKNVETSTYEDVTTRANKIIDDTHFQSIKYNPYDLEDALSNEIVDLQIKASSARYDGDFELAEKLENKIKSLKEQRIELTNLRHEEGISPEVLHKDPNYQAREYTPEKIARVTAFANLSPDWTAGEKLAVLSDGLVNLNIAIENCIKNGDTKTANLLMETYNSAKAQRIALAEEARQNPDNPEFDLHIPKNAYPKYAPKVKKTNIEQKSTGSKSPYRVDNVDVNIDEIVNGLLGNAVNNTAPQIDESKLADVSVGQMGVFEEESKETNISTTPQIDESKLADVSIGQMGVFDDLDEIIDDAINETEQSANTQKTENQINVQTNNKSVDNVKANSDKLDIDKVFNEDKNTINKSKVDNVKANEEKIDIDELFKEWGILDKVQPTNQDKEKSKDDDDDYER